MGKKYSGTGAPYVLSGVNGKCRTGLGTGSEAEAGAAESSEALFPPPSLSPLPRRLGTEVSAQSL